MALPRTLPCEYEARKCANVTVREHAWVIRSPFRGSLRGPSLPHNLEFPAVSNTNEILFTGRCSRTVFAFLSCSIASLLLSFARLSSFDFASNFPTDRRRTESIISSKIISIADGDCKRKFERLCMTNDARVNAH